MRLDDGWMDRLRDRVVLSDIVRRKVALTKRGQEFIGLCPFHSEKTPSFHVVDDKGFYHCFGCQAHGDAIGFLMNAQGMEFMDAVKMLADDVGLDIPKQTFDRPAEPATALSGHEVMKLAQLWFADVLFSTSGRAALQYLRDRGIDGDAIGHFGLGFAPANADELRDKLIGAGALQDQLISLGLFRTFDNDTTKLHGFFRNRIMFPILDGRAKVIAFGGRYMGDSKADHVGKYINSQQTILFDKGASLYNLHNARRTARDEGRLVVVEGYMDVIAFWRAGVSCAVAPLGTALGERQLESIWRVNGEPTICFDGDAAGVRAANKTADLALCVMRTGHSLRFAFLPDGMDPDNLLETHGKASLRAVLEDPQPLHMVIWNNLVATHSSDTPEGRAKLAKAIESLCQRIGDESLAREYRAELRNLLWRNNATRYQKSGDNRKFKRSDLVQLDQKLPNNIHNLQINTGKSILAVLLRHPYCIESHLEKLSQLALSPTLDKLVEMLLEFTVNTKTELTYSTLVTWAQDHGVSDLMDEVMSDDILRMTLAAQAQSSRDDAEAFLAQTWAGIDQSRLQGSLQEWFWSDQQDDNALNKLLEDAEAQKLDVEKQFLKTYE